MASSTLARSSSGRAEEIISSGGGGLMRFLRAGFFGSGLFGSSKDAGLVFGDKFCALSLGGTGPSWLGRLPLASAILSGAGRFVLELACSSASEFLCKQYQ